MPNKEFAVFYFPMFSATMKDYRIFVFIPDPVTMKKLLYVIFSGCITTLLILLVPYKIIHYLNISDIFL